MDKDYIKLLIQNIVNKEFSMPVMRQINVHEDRLNFRCVFCHEGKTINKKRANLYFNKMLVVCFRCGKTSTLDKVCKMFDEQIDPDKKMEMIKYLDNVITYNDYQDDVIETSYENLINLSDIEEVISRSLTQFSDFTPIKINGGIYKYLCGRGIETKYHKNIYQAKYWKNDDEYEWVIIMLNRKDNKVLGMQVRNLKEGKRRLFKIYNYESLLEMTNLLKIEPITIDTSEIVMYNKLSYFFNILNINFNQKITIFEGYIDSLFYPNSIGMVGVNTNMNFLENNNLDIQYFFDNDDVGLKKSEQKLREGYDVFLWNKLFYGIVSRKNSEDPFKLEYRIGKVKDLNKLVQLVPNAYRKLDLFSFFSTDIMDIKWIPKSKKIKYDNSVDYNKKFNDFNNI